MSSSAPFYAVPDGEARREALAVDRSFLVQAPAGSGKTELLIQRFLALLAAVQAPESVVAVTFTRKAASEMQGRVLDALGRADRGEAPETSHERVSYELALAALQQDRRMGWRLAEHPSRLRIQTIDALCASITRQVPWLARLGAQPGVTEDAEPLYLEAARRTLAQIEEDTPYRAALASVLLHLDNNVGRAARLIASMLNKRDQWLPLVAAGDVRREDLEGAMANAVAGGLTRVERLMTMDLRREVVDLAGGQDASAETHPPWLRLLETLLTGDGEWRRTVDKRQGFPSNSPEKARCLALLGRLRPHEELREALVSLRTLPPARYADGQWRVTHALFDVLKLAVAHLKLVFRERGEVDFCEVAERARGALGRMDAPSDLALGLDARIEHLLVDEFQDTSVAQFELVEMLTAGWEPGDGRTLFLVGDPMQSIYRFRKAEVGLFLKTAGGTVGRIAPHSLRLSANHRSVAGIVHWVNRAFARVFQAWDDIDAGAIAFSPFAAVLPAGVEEAVTVHALGRGEYAREADLVSRLVQETRAESPKGSIAILVRARTHLPWIVAALRRDGLPFQAIDIDPLGERPAVRDLAALTRAMLHLADSPAWLAILRAPWCGLTLADLHALVGLAGRREGCSTAWDLLGGDLAALSPEGRERAGRLRRTMETAFAGRGRLPLRRWVERTWQALGGPACLSGENDLQDAEGYLDLVERHEAAGDLADSGGFREAIGKLYARPDSSADGRLQVLTIHKAKGLQFDTVIVPGLGRRPPREDSPLFLAAERPRPDGSVDRLIATIRETGSERDPLYSYLWGLEKKKSLHESGRLLYVAATRAVRRLHLIGHARRSADGALRPEGGSLLERLWPGLSEEERQRFERAGEQAAGTVPPRGVPLRRLPLTWTAPSLPAPEAAGDARPSYLWVGDQLRHVGTVVHAALEQIAAGRTPGPYRSALANLGVVPAELDEAERRVEEAVRRTLASERGRWILAAHAEARCEHRIAGAVDGEIVRGTVDRTFIDADGARWIIDYKSSMHAGGSLDFFLDEEVRRYRPQLERYARLLAHEGRPIRMGLYFPLLDAWREI